MKTGQHFGSGTEDRTELLLKKGKQLHTIAVGEAIISFLSLFSTNRNHADADEYLGNLEEENVHFSGGR